MLSVQNWKRIANSARLLVLDAFHSLGIFPRILFTPNYIKFTVLRVWFFVGIQAFELDSLAKVVRCAFVCCRVNRARGVSVWAPLSFSNFFFFAVLRRLLGSLRTAQPQLTAGNLRKFFKNGFSFIYFYWVLEKSSYETRSRAWRSCLEKHMKQCTRRREVSSVLAVQETRRRRCSGVKRNSSERQQPDIKIVGSYWKSEINPSKTR
jgi:hypothetical protein